MIMPSADDPPQAAPPTRSTRRAVLSLGVFVAICVVVALGVEAIGALNGGPPRVKPIELVTPAPSEELIEELVTDPPATTIPAPATTIPAPIATVPPLPATAPAIPAPAPAPPSIDGDDDDGDDGDADDGDADDDVGDGDDDG